MKNLKLLGITLSILFLLTACVKETLLSPSESLQNRGRGERPKTPDYTPDFKDKLSELFSRMPEGYKDRLKLSSSLPLQLHPEYSEMAHRAVDPTPCDASNTALNQWLGGELQGWNQVIDNNGNTVFDYAAGTGMLDFPTYDALLFENSSSGQYFGANGEYSQKTTKTFKDLKRFWNIESGGMVSAAMHGRMLRDRDKVIRIDRILFGDDQATAEFYADLILFLLENVPQYRNGDHPIFTFNAFAQSSFTFGGVTIPDKIVMGDGIIDAYEGIGFGDVASQAVLAHEYGHQVQFQLNVFGNMPSPEATRRTELMADALSAYYLSHARGASMQWKRVELFLQVFFNIGDCSFSSNGHHGTPTQRMAAAEWGYLQAENAPNQGHIFTAEDFIQLFDETLPELVVL